MPYKSESIRLQGLQDRRRKLTDDQRDAIKDMYSTGAWSLNKLAREFNVSKKTVLLIVNPCSAENAKRYVHENWRNFQRTKEERTTATREHRRYKQALFLRGELKKEGS